MKGVLLWLVRWARRAGTRDFWPALAALVGIVQTIFFLTAHYFTSFVPHFPPSWQAVVPRRLPPNMCLWSLTSPIQQSWAGRRSTLAL